MAEKVLNPFRFVVIVLAGWMNQRQQNVIEYLREENQVLREQLGERRLRFTDVQRRPLKSVGLDCVKLPPRLPNLNAYAERFVRSIKESCLNRLILFGEQSLRRAIREFVTHINKREIIRGSAID